MLCLCKTSCRVAEVFWVDARALPVCPCAGCFDEHDISCHLVHNIYIELSHTELRQKSPITHSLPSVVYTTKAFYLWSCFVQALEGIAVHCVTRLSVVFSCSMIEISVVYKRVSERMCITFKMYCSSTSGGQTKNVTSCCIYCLFIKRFARMGNRISDLA